MTILNHHDIYLRLTVGGVTSSPFSGTTLRPEPAGVSYREQIVKLTRERYARPRAVVEKNAEQHFLSSRGLPMAGSRKAGRCFPPETDQMPWPQRSNVLDGFSQLSYSRTIWQPRHRKLAPSFR